MNEADGWWVGVDDNDPEVMRWFCAFRNTPMGKKIIYSGTDGTREAISEFKNVRVKLYSDPGQHYYSEASGPIERMLERAGVTKVPADEVGKIINKPIEILDDYAYERSIGGHMHRKVMFGHPKAARLQSSLLRRSY